jgi:hypothetical protein
MQKSRICIDKRARADISPGTRRQHLLPGSDEESLVRAETKALSHGGWGVPTTARQWSACLPTDGSC